MGPRLSAGVRRRLLAWFGTHRRDLPWRRDRDPYRIWVSEVMLQQTQVATVIPFFERFVKAFPNLRALAAADEQQVLRLWEGLGYYRRARDLHRAARLIVEQDASAIPNDPAVFGALPGVGRYILGAVLSQAFDTPLPIVEANSLRVLCRFFGFTDDPRSTKGQRWLWTAAESLVPKRHVGELNQALMELGALVCTSTAPRCMSCPLAKNCVANQNGLQQIIPRRPGPQAIVDVQEVAVVIRRGSRMLLVQRPPEGRWAGLWEFPHGPLKPNETHEQGAARIVPELTGVGGEVGTEIVTVKHGVTRFRITLVCFGVRYRRGRFLSVFYPRGAWVEPRQLRDYPVSAPQRRVARALLSGGQQQLF
jgi:A/G-specific adenine glycosylase